MEEMVLLMGRLVVTQEMAALLLGLAVLQTVLQALVLEADIAAV
jgi:hypothetical protein